MLGMIIISILALFLTFISNFKLVKIIGDSMYPTYKNNNFVVAKVIKNRNYKFKLNRIYLYKLDEKIVMKRLTGIFPDGRLFFEGDNSSCSCDSRVYGSVNPDKVKAKVIFGKRRKLNGKV